MPQGTIRDYDPATGQGSLLTDDRLEVAIEPGSIAQEAIRSLRLGQRVRFEIEELEGRPVARGLRIVTFD
ncbi:MAG: hypothetical protein KatS3mg013_0188 [Actinomycetota bacterium]|jgi:cold shock CspA family protein|nr:MAG: hypothetical protein KatS3mg013_0188 [Actinomycetota bacterium]